MVGLDSWWPRGGRRRDAPARQHSTMSHSSFAASLRTRDGADVGSVAGSDVSGAWGGGAAAGEWAAAGGGAGALRRVRLPPPVAAHDGGSPRRLLDRAAAFHQSRGRFQVRRRVGRGRRRRWYLADAFHTLAGTRMHRLVVLLFVTYAFVFTLFAGLYLILRHSRWCRDSDMFRHLGYYDALFLSIETMMTIGYGVEDEFFQNCRMFLPIFTVQLVGGVVLNALIVGLVYTRFSRASGRRRTVIFSRAAALICVDGDDGPPSLAFRVGEVRRRHLIEAQVRCYLVTQRPVAGAGGSDALDAFQMYPLALAQPSSEQIVLALPQVVVHRVDGGSPLRHLLHPWRGLAPLRAACAEVVVLLEGVEALTSATIQARHSYTPADIVPGARFEQIVTASRRGAAVAFARFHAMWVPRDPGDALCAVRSPVVARPPPGSCGSDDDGDGSGCDAPSTIRDVRATRDTRVSSDDGASDVGSETSSPAASPRGVADVPSPRLPAAEV